MAHQGLHLLISASEDIIKNLKQDEKYIQLALYFLREEVQSLKHANAPMYSNARLAYRNLLKYYSQLSGRVGDVEFGIELDQFMTITDPIALYIMGKFTLKREKTEKQILTSSQEAQLSSLTQMIEKRNFIENSSEDYFLDVTHTEVREDSQAWKLGLQLGLRLK